MASDFHIVSSSIPVISTSTHKTQFIQSRRQFYIKKIGGKSRKNEGIASSRNRKCKVYLIVVLRLEPNFFPGSALRCYNCYMTECNDPYTTNDIHIQTCERTWDYCAKINFNNGKWLHS